MAGTIDQLNFEVILTDDAFRKKVNEDIGLAEKLNAHLSDALNFTRKIKTEPLTKTKKAFEDIEKSAKKAAKAQAQYESTVGKTNTRLASTSSLMRTLGQLTGATFSVLGLRRFLSTLIDVTGQFEVQKMALRNMLQDIDGADKIFQDLYNFSSQSTYRFSELAKYAKQLAAFNIDQSNLLETTKMLGDVASGVGVSMDRLILAYGHVKSSGFLRGIQLRSFSQNGVPILEELSKMFTEIEGKAVSLGDVFDKMMKREIGFDMVEEAFRRMTSEGGKFYQMQEVLAKTLSGQINILKGKWENLMYAIGESQEGVLKGAVKILTDLVSNTEKFGRAIGEAVVILGAYKVAATLATIATSGFRVAFAKTIATMQKMMAFVTSNPFAILATTIAIATVTIINYTNELNEAARAQNAVAKAHAEWQTQLHTEIAELEQLYYRLQEAKEGTSQYAEAKRALESRFGPYIEQLRSEGVEVNNLAVLYENLKNKVQESAYARFVDTANKDLDEIHATTIGQVLNGGGKNPYTVAKLAKSLGIEGRDLAALQQIALGSKTYEDVLRSGLAPGLIDKLEKGQIEAGRGVFISAKQYLGYVVDRVNESTDAWEKGRQSVLEYGEAMSQLGVGGGSENGGPQNIIKIESIIAGIKKIDAELAGLRKKAQSTGGITEDEQKRIEALTEDREEQVKLYKSIMGQDYDKAVKSSAKAQEDAQKKERDGIKAQITLLEKYRDTREKLEPFFGSDTDDQLADIFGKDTDYATLDAQIKALCDDLRRLGDEGVQAAEQIESRLGLDKASSIIQAQKALQKWQATLRKWQKDWGGDFHGIEYDIDKVVRDYNNEDEEITRDYLDSLNEIMEAHWGDAEAIQREVDALDKLVAARRAANSTAAQENLNDLAAKYVKENTKDLNLRDWGDKSIGQIRGIYRTLTELAAGEIVVDETLKKRLDEAGVKIEDFAKLSKEEFEKLADNAKEELMKRLGDTIREVISDLGGLASAMGEVAEMSGNKGVVAFADAMTNMMPMVESTIDRLSKGDYIGAVVGWFSQVVTGFFRAKQEVMQLNAAIRAAKEDARRSGLSDMLTGGTESIFGANGMARVNNALSVINKVRSTMGSRGVLESFSVKRGFWDWFVNEGGMSKLRYMQFSISELAQSVGRDLYDAYGNLNAETLQAILDTYENLGQTEKEWITQAINDSEAYAEAMEQLKGVVESVFGEIASSSSDAIVEQWKERSDAALDYADILDDVATRYAKMMVESEILDRVLTPEKASEIVDMFSRGDSEGAMERIAEDMAAIQGMAPVFEQILTAFDPYFNRAGAESASNSLAAGINKELVEGNSSLIASYINAMRADLSVIRGFQSTGWQDIRLIREYAPTYADYMARIEANTYDNAQAAQSILARLQSIITPSTNGGSAVRTTR